MTIYEIIRRPLDTEKYDRARDDHNQYAFEIDKRATKLQVKEAVESLFKVSVTKVTTHHVKGKLKRVGQHVGHRPDWKRAVVSLKEGDAISLFEGT